MTYEIVILSEKEKKFYCIGDGFLYVNGKRVDKKLTDTARRVFECLLHATGFVYTSYIDHIAFNDKYTNQGYIGKDFNGQVKGHILKIRQYLGDEVVKSEGRNDRLAYSTDYKINIVSQLPFGASDRPNLEEERQLYLKKLYDSLVIFENRSDRSRLRDKYFHEYYIMPRFKDEYGDNMSSPIIDRSRFKAVFFGAAGYGKTMLQNGLVISESLRELSSFEKEYAFSVEEIEFYNEFHNTFFGATISYFPVFIECKDYDGGTDILTSAKFSDCEGFQALCEDALSKGNLLICLDGLDECPEELRGALKKTIIQINDKSNVIITSRYIYWFQEELEKYEKIEVSSFDNFQIKKYISKLHNKKSVEEAIAFIENDTIKELMFSPFMLEKVHSAFEDSKYSVFSIIESYAEDVIGRRKKNKDSNYALVKDKVKFLREIFGYIAWRMLKDGVNTIEYNECKNIFSIAKKALNIEGKFAQFGEYSEIVNLVGIIDIKDESGCLKVSFCSTVLKYYLASKYLESEYLKFLYGKTENTQQIGVIYDIDKDLFSTDINEGILNTFIMLFTCEKEDKQSKQLKDLYKYISEYFILRFLSSDRNEERDLISDFFMSILNGKYGKTAFTAEQNRDVSAEKDIIKILVKNNEG